MKKLLILVVKVYRKIISPPLTVLFGSACRFTPTCSEYTIEALERFGTIKGSRMGISRLARCHPWGGSGFDPVPEKQK